MGGNAAKIAIDPPKVADHPRRWGVLALLSFIYMLNYADRQVISVLAEPIKQELGLADTQLSLLTGTFFALFYSTLSIPIAMLADRVSRVKIISLACFTWSVFTGLTGLASTYMLMAAARIGVAAGEAGGAAPSLSLISDLFPPQDKVRAVSLFTAASPVGILLGTMGGGMLASLFGWRSALFVLAIVGMISAPFLLALAADPRRVGARRQLEAPEPLRETCRAFWLSPSLRWLLLAVAFYSCAANSVLSWMPALLIRHYGASLNDVARFYGPVVAISFFISLVGSGFILPRLLRYSARYYAALPALQLIVCAPLLILTLSLSDWRSVVGVLFVPLVLLNGLMAPALTLVQELTPQKSRATSTSLLLLVLNLVGLGLGPLIVGAASDLLHGVFAGASLYWAMVFVLPFEVICAAACLLICAHHLPREIPGTR